MHRQWRDGCNGSKESSPVESGGKAEHVCAAAAQRLMGWKSGSCLLLLPM